MDIRRIVPITGDGNCLFRAVSYCLYRNEERHSELRLQTVTKIVADWNIYKDFIIGDESYRLPLNNQLEYENLMSLNGEYAGHVELHGISQLFNDYLFRVHNDETNHVVDYGNGSVICHLLFSGSVDAGHYSVIEYDINLGINPTVNRRIRRKRTLTGRVETTNRRKTMRNRRKGETTFNIKYKSAISETMPDIMPYSVGSLTNECKHCSALFFSCEKTTLGYFGLCCCNGKINLPEYKILDRLKPFFTGNDDTSRNFRENIRQYNNSMSFVSFGANVTVPPEHGPYCFKISGIVHHRISSIYSKNISDSCYGQLYVLDCSEANQIRLANRANSCIREGTLHILNNILQEHNPYIQLYKTMHSKICEENELALREKRQPLDLVMRFYHEPQEDPRRYNNPASSEIAAIFETTDGAPASHRHIAVFSNQGVLKEIDVDSMHCDPLTYVLIWPCGETGWHISLPTGGNRKTNVRQNMTMREYILYRLSIRGCPPAGGFNPLLNAGKLTQQLIVDYYCRIEGDRLKYIRNQQTKLRVDTYVGLADALHFRAENESLRAGRIVILPSTFIGSPRNMLQNYQDAMAIVRKFGKPDLFITFTCNPSWPEITTSLQPYENANNRPDVVVRVFHAKVKELLRLINQKQIFGEVQTFLYTVEFQKRGLPHIHLLVCLRDSCKLREIYDIDMTVSAEIPDPSNTTLYNLVKTHMVHGPCGLLNPNSICMKDGRCKKGFPKDFVPETKENVNGYPLYRRRQNGRSYTKRVQGTNVEIDNRFIVPYNRYLLMYFQAHINVEICASVHSIKYIHKYVYKGHDCANLKITANDGMLHHDEVSMYLNARYVGSSEAAYRIFGYNMHEQSHIVARLPVHLPDQQDVFFHADDAPKALIRAQLKSTQLTAWFQLNQNPTTRSAYIYPETPVHYVWDKCKCIWKKRLRFEKVIGRMYNVSPSESERYHLRLLLLHIVGATSFEDLRTYQGVTCPTYKDMAIKLGLLIDDSEWQRCLMEASVFQMPFQLRQLFAYICIFHQPCNASHLWDMHKNSLCEDYLKSEDENTAYQLSLRDINKTLQLHGFSLPTFNLPVGTDTHSNDQTTNEPVFPFDLADLMSLANQEQLSIINEITSVLQNNNTTVTNAFFIDGAGGTGKTFIYRCLIQKFWSLGLHVISVAWTGIAAVLLPNGRTVHSTFKIPLNLNESSVSGLKLNSKAADDIRLARLIIWDEAPMANIHSLMCVNRLLKDIMGNDIPFGGKITVLGGDFRQVLPVVPHASRQTIIQNCIKYSPLWPFFKIRCLYKNMRLKPEEIEFSDFLLQIGNGDYPSVDGEESNVIELPPRILAHDDIVTEIYGETFISTKDIINFSKVCILTPKNEHCNEINLKVIELIPGSSKTYTSVNRLITEDESQLLQFPTEFLNSLELSGLPPHILTLKVGAIVMLLRNLNVSQGLLNGTRLFVKNMYENCLDLEIISGDKIGQRALIPRVDLTPSDKTLPFSFKRRQFPIRLAFCITINKAQGETLERVGLYLPQQVFSHGQLYVAMSRVRSFDALKVSIVPKSSRTKNVVYKEILR